MIDRLKYNRKILKLLTRMVERYPELRFTQILTNLNLDCDRFYEEPNETYERLAKDSKKFRIEASDFLINALDELCKRFPEMSVEYSYNEELKHHIVKTNLCSSNKLAIKKLAEETALRTNFTYLYPEDRLLFFNFSSNYNMSKTNCLFKYNVL